MGAMRHEFAVGEAEEFLEGHDCAYSSFYACYFMDWGAAGGAPKGIIDTGAFDTNI